MSVVMKPRYWGVFLGFCFAVGLMSLQQVSAYTAEFELQDLNGKVHRLSDYRGKWVVVNYWATWCPPCREEIPDLELFHNKYKDTEAVVLGVNMENTTTERLKKFVEDQFISYPILRGGLRSTTSLGRVSGMPTTFLVSPEGKVVARHSGVVTMAALEAFIKEYKP